MSNVAPVAIINGIDRFGARKLAELLGQNNIKVVGVGEYTGGLQELNNFEYRTELDEVEESGEYWFDFDESIDAWRRAESDGAKLTIVGVNRVVDKNRIPSDLKANWRIINFHGVYGPGMEHEKEETGEVDYLIEAIKLAVANKNLILPSRKIGLRLLSDSELTEVAMRGSFLSGTEGEVFEVWGGIINSEELAKVLIEDAKMTRFKVIESGDMVVIPEKGVVEDVYAKLRWQPKTKVSDGLNETLQTYFAKADEENRNGKGLNPSKSPFDKGDFKTSEIKEEKKIANGKRFEVMVEEGEQEKEEKPKIERPTPEVEERLEEEKPKAETVEKLEQEEKPKIESQKPEVEEVVEESEVVEIEEFKEIKSLLVKNSNNRPVKPENDQSLMINEKKEETAKPTPNPSLDKEGDTKIEKEKKKKNINLIKWGWRILGGIWLGVIILILVWVGSNYWMIKNSLNLKTLIEERKYAEASMSVKKIKTQVNQEEIFVEDWGLNRWVWGRRYQNVLKVWEEGLVVGEKAIELSQTTELVNEAVFKDKQINWAEQLIGLKKEMGEGDEALGLLQARLSGDWNWIPARWKGNLGDAKQQISEAKTMMGYGGQVVDILPEFLGIDGKRREYMILLQNETELRPGGGFIGSYGLLTFQGGKLLNFEIKDVYEADGQLSGHVEPPEAIKNYLGEANWFMRDANWQADFRLSAKDIQWFLEKETARKVDGVIGVDLAVARALLEVTGEVYVADFKEKINKDNLYEQAEFYSETKFFPGSNQKASFLSGVGRQLFEEIKNLKGEKRLELVKAVFDMFEKNEIQMALNNKTAAETVANLGWNGAIYEGKCATSTALAPGGQANCFADYLYIVEANVGVNKANYFLYRNIDQVVDIGKQSIGRVVKINYENTSKNNNWPGGDYKNYMRVYVPSSANLAEVSTTDLLSGLKTIYQGDSLKVNTVKDKKEIGFLVTVPVGKKVTVEISYSNQIDLNGKDRFSYLNYIQKQPGFGDTGLVTLISLPEEWQPTQVEPMASLVSGKLLFNQKLEKDIKMGVEISK